MLVYDIGEPMELPPSMRALANYPHGSPPEESRPRGTCSISVQVCAASASRCVCVCIVWMWMWMGGWLAKCMHVRLANTHACARTLRSRQIVKWKIHKMRQAIGDWVPPQKKRRRSHWSSRTFYVHDVECLWCRGKWHRWRARRAKGAGGGGSRSGGGAGGRGGGWGREWGRA
jgi:hypothetical protein